MIAGARTASGKPLLANDMHLALTEPNVWYIADLKAPGFHAAGVTLPGMPYIVAGHNEHVGRKVGNAREVGTVVDGRHQFPTVTVLDAVATNPVIAPTPTPVGVADALALCAARKPAGVGG